MNDEKWEDLKIKIEERFKDLKKNIEDETREDDTGQKIDSTIETLEFTSPIGLLKISRTSRPKILDKKTHYHKGAGVRRLNMFYRKMKSTMK